METQVRSISNTLILIDVVEAAGVEPASPQNANWLMARDFSSQVTGNSLPCGQLVVLWSALESSGVLPSLGDILETSAARREDGDVDGGSPSLRVVLLPHLVAS